MLDEEIIVPEIGVSALLWRVQLIRSEDSNMSCFECGYHYMAHNRAHSITGHGREEGAIGCLVFTEPVVGTANLGGGIRD